MSYEIGVWRWRAEAGANPHTVYLAGCEVMVHRDAAPLDLKELYSAFEQEFGSALDDVDDRPFLPEDLEVGKRLGQRQDIYSLTLRVSKLGAELPRIISPGSGGRDEVARCPRILIADGRRS